MKRRTALFLVLGSHLLGEAPATAAAQAPEAARGRAERAAAPSPAQPWDLRLETHGLTVDEAALRKAVARELARTDVRPGTEPVQIQVSVAQGGSLQVRYRGPAGAELSRSVVAPSRGDEVPEASALLVGNLARDEASSLLAELSRQRPAAASEPGSAPSLPIVVETARDVPVVPPLESVNFSLFHPLTVRGDTERRHLACEFGLFYSHSAAVSGLSLTAFGVSRVDGPAYGLQLGGIGYWHGGPGAGARVGGLFGVSASRFDGLSVTGLGSWHGGEHIGADVAGFTSVVTGPLAGAQLSGFFDYAASVSGVQAAGFSSVAAGPIAGAQLSGFFDYASRVSGVQAAGFASLSAASVDGLQIAGGTSIAGDVRGLQLSVLNIGGSIDGAQIGVVNVADDVTGLQLGVVNVARSVKGQSLGLVPYNRQGGVKLVTWYDSTQPFNLGVRFAAGALYVMPTFAFDPGSAPLLSDPGLARYALGTSLGLRLPIDRTFVDIEANQSQPSQGWKNFLEEYTLNLRYRVLAGYRVLPGFSVFAGGGLRQRKSDVEPELSVGMELL